MVDFKFLRRRVIIGYNAEKTLRLGFHRERFFYAVGIWPLLIGIERKGVGGFKNQTPNLNAEKGGTHNV